MISGGVENAFFAIAGMVASKFGAGLDNDNAFDFTIGGAPGFLLTDAEIMIDVIVRSVGLTAASLSAAPQKLENVW